MEIFGPHTARLLALLGNLDDLTRSEIGRVADAWREGDPQERASAWVRVHRALAEADRQPVLAAAAVARQEAQAVARRHGWPEWPFWAAAADAGAAVAAGDRIGECYAILVAPLASVLPSLQRVGDPASGVLQQGA